MQTYTFRAVSWDDEVGAALDDALGQIEAKARAAGAVLTSLSHQVTLTRRNRRCRRPGRAARSPSASRPA